MRTSQLSTDKAQASILAKLLSDLTVQQFVFDISGRQPIARPTTGIEFYRLISWPLIEEIISSGHDDCWLVENGLLDESHIRERRSLDFRDVVRGYTNGKTLVIRRAERASAKIAAVAHQFANIFDEAIDVQIYVTPAGQKGFDWHWDLEDVFVIQSSGQKEFSLRKNRFAPTPATARPRTLREFESLSEGPEIRCRLAAGDFLYIPSGYWHKARAISDSFHMSIGVMPDKFDMQKNQEPR